MSISLAPTRIAVSASLRLISVLVAPGEPLAIGGGMVAMTAYARVLLGVALAGGLLVLLLVLGAINRFVLLDFPNSGDEYVYLYQAWTMATGRLWNAPVEPARKAS